MYRSRNLVAAKLPDAPLSIITSTETFSFLRSIFLCLDMLCANFALIPLEGARDLTRRKQLDFGGGLDSLVDYGSFRILCC